MTSTQISKLSVEQLDTFSTDQIIALTTSQAAALTATQVASLSTAVMAKMDTQDIAALTTTAIHALTTAQISNLTTDQIAALSTDQVHNLTSTLANALTTPQKSALSGAALTELMTTFNVSPLILDLNGDGIRTVGIDGGVKFDLLATGHAANVGWASAQDGFLVNDINHDGVINDGSEMFGVATKLANGSLAHDGYQALAAQDTNHDGVINAADMSYASLQVWTDTNQDGISQASELHSLKDLGITQLDLGAKHTSVLDQGNWIGLESSYTTADGKTHAMADVWLQISQAQTPPPANLQLDLSKVDLASLPAAGMAKIDISGNGGNGDAVTLSAADVQRLGHTDLVVNAETGAGHVQMLIQGDANDVVKMTDAQHWVNAGTTVVDGQTFQILNDGNLQLLVGTKVHHDPTGTT